MPVWWNWFCGSRQHEVGLVTNDPIVDMYLSLERGRTAKGSRRRVWRVVEESRKVLKGARWGGESGMDVRMHTLCCSSEEMRGKSMRVRVNVVVHVCSV